MFETSYISNFYMPSLSLLLIFNSFYTYFFPSFLGYFSYYWSTDYKIIIFYSDYDSNDLLDELLWGELFLLSSLSDFSYSWSVSDYFSFII